MGLQLGNPNRELFMQQPLCRRRSRRKGQILSRAMTAGGFIPSILNLELTNACNLACVFCDHPRLKARMARAEMDSGLLEKVLRDMSGHHIFELGLVGLGEPLLDRKLEEHLGIIDDYRSGFDRISLNSNGAALSEKKAHIICRSCVNFITFSVNATSRQAYRRLMGKDRYEPVLANIRKFLEIRQSCKRNDLQVSIQIMPSAENETHKLIEAFHGFDAGDLNFFQRDVYRKPALDRTTYVAASLPDQERRYPCWSMFSRVYVDANGHLYPCTIGNDCYREASGLMLGNISENDLRALFNGPTIEEARRRAMASDLPFSECERCNVWSLLPNNFTWDEDDNRWVLAGEAVRLSSYDA